MCSSKDIIDLSHNLNSQTIVYPGDPEFSSCPHLTLSADGVRVVKLTLGSHTGTHIDAPSHFVKDGKSIDEIPLNNLVGPAVVVDLTKTGHRGRDLEKRELIKLDDLLPYEGQIIRLVGAGESVIVLLHTGWPKYWGKEEYVDHPYLSPDAAQWLINLGIQVLGVDTFSPDETIINHEDDSEPSFAAHHIVLGQDKIIAENLKDLDMLLDDEWIISLLPLKLDASDGSPVRACAWRKGHR
jgi:kynurenine formamidase